MSLEELPTFSDTIRIRRDSNEHYHSHSQYVSSSVVKTIAKQSVHHYLNQKPFNSPALAIGTAFHTLVLEPHEFDKEYLVVHQKLDKRTKVGKAEVKRLEEEAEKLGKELLLRDPHNLIQSMSSTVQANPEYVRLLDHCQKEISFYIDDFRIPALPGVDFQVRVRPDAYSKQPIEFGGQTLPNVVIDLKSCQDSSPRAFRSSVYMYGWHIQAAFYLDLLTHVAKKLGLPDFNDFYFMAVEKKHPFACQVYALSAEMLEDGRQQYWKALTMWKHYLDTNEELGFHTGTDIGQLVITLG